MMDEALRAIGQLSLVIFIICSFGIVAMSPFVFVRFIVENWTNH